jgi:Uma2 family endonuclease
MAHAQKILPHYTYDDWKLWEGKWELMDGFPIAMSPAPLPKHQRIAASLQSEFVVALKKCKNCFAYDPLDYKIADDTIFIPDMLVVCRKITKPFLDFAPALVVEILSPSSILRDRNTKYTTYEEQGVRYYLIVDTDRESVEVYELQNGKYVLKISDSNLYHFEFEKGCNTDVNFSEIW